MDVRVLQAICVVGLSMELCVRRCAGARRLIGCKHARFAKTSGWLFSTRDTCKLKRCSGTRAMPMEYFINWQTHHRHRRLSANAAWQAKGGLASHQVGVHRPAAHRKRYTAKASTWAHTRPSINFHECVAANLWRGRRSGGSPWTPRRRSTC